MKNKITKRESNLIGFVILIVAIVLSVLIFNNKEEPKIKVPIAEKEVSIVEREFKAGFIEGCTEDNLISYSVCNCAYNKMINHYGFNKLLELSLEYIETEELPAKTIDFLVECENETWK